MKFSANIVTVLFLGGISIARSGRELSSLRGGVWIKDPDNEDVGAVSVKILSSNAHLFEGSLAGTFSPSSVYADRERKAELLRRAKEGQYDIIGFTEVWADDMRESFGESLSPSHMSYIPQPDVDWFSGTFSGSPGMVLSTLVEDGDWAFGPFFDHYKGMVNADQLAYKGVAYGAVRVKGTLVGWVQTHAQASYMGTEDTDREARKRQMLQTLFPASERVKNFMKSQDSGREGPTVLFGDLNIVAGTEEYDWFKAEVAKMGFADCWTETHPVGGEPGYTYDPVNNPLVRQWDPSQSSPQRLDYVFLSPGDARAECTEMNVLTDWTASVGTESVRVSDHDPIEVTVRILNPTNGNEDPPNSPSSTKKSAGESCSSDDECANDACGRPSAGTDNLVCCPSDENTLYAFFDYCTGMPGGTPCWSDTMCASGNCDGNWGGLRKGSCS